ncbi:MAG: high-potential iron-sulfur protein [Pseudomonadota bacterium]
MMNRRNFIKMIPAACVGLAAAPSVLAAPASVAENDPTAIALNYKVNVKSVKSPKYVKGQLCKNCMFYQGAASAANAPCPLFGGKLVAGNGWCSGYAKKA